MLDPGGLLEVRDVDGSKALEGARAVKMLGRYVPVRAEVVSLPSFSVHADHDELLAWLDTASCSPERVFLVHGEPEATAALDAAIDERIPGGAVVPAYGERVRLD